MFIKDKGLMVGLLVFAVVVGLLIAQEVRLNLRSRHSARIIGGLSAPLEENSAVTVPVIRSTDPLIGQGQTQLFFFGDFTCAACRDQWQLLRTFQSRNPKAISIIWKDTVDLSVAGSLSSALAARCSGKYFDKFADELFAASGQLTEAQYQLIAKKINLPVNEFTLCQKDPATISLIQADVAEAIALGLTETPTVYVKGRWYIGGLTDQELENL